MTYTPFSHGIDFDVILQDPTIAIPSEEFSMLNALASAVAALGLRERDKLRSRVTEFWPKNPDAVGAVWELLFMDESTPNRDSIARLQNKYQLLALYLYDSAYQQMLET